MQNQSATIAVTTLGCKVNQCDSAAMIACLEQSGYRVVPFNGTADIYIVNSCVVTRATEAQSRRLIQRALKKNPAARVLATGCYAQSAPRELSALSPHVRVLGNSRKKDISLYVADLLAGTDGVEAVTDIAQERTFTTPPYGRFLERTRAFLKIQDGCSSRCSYCIVPSVRGMSRSLPAVEVRARLMRLVQAGYREIVLTGVHLGAYGLDLTPPAALGELLETLEKDDRLRAVRIRLSSLEPAELTDELVQRIADSQIICPHLHVPLQSGDDTILRKMQRPYSAGFFKERLERLVALIPDVNIGVDVIAGFPGETDEQFDHTVNLITALPIAYLHAFPYSPRPGTDAARLSPHVSAPVKKQRVQILRDISARKKQAFYAEYCGTILRVLVESARDRHTGLLKGFSRNYIPVRFEGPESLGGEEAAVRIKAVNGEHASGVLVNGSLPACALKKTIGRF